VKIAITSSDGKNLDTHLGKATSLYIYDLDGENTKFVEKRKTGIDTSKQHSGSLVLETAKDCKVVFSTKYGFKSKVKADDEKIKLVIDEGPIDEVLKRYINHVNFMSKNINI